jgi:hypothetical protein
VPPVLGWMNQSKLMKTPSSLKSLRLVPGIALALVSFASAQPAMTAVSRDSSHGLLGQTYTGVGFGYVHHVEAPPRARHRYGFVSSRPLLELGETTDAAFRYDYTRSSASGERRHRHDVAVGFTRYVENALTKPFLRADAGYAMRKEEGRTRNSFAYVAGAGVEVAVAPWLALTPYANFHHAPSLDSGRWQFGATASHRFNRAWSSTLGVQMDTKHNLEYAVGLQRRF